MLGHSVIFFVLLHLPTVAASRRRAIETWPPPKIPPSARRPRRNEGSSFVLTNFKIGNSGPEINPAGPAHTRARALTHSHTERKPLFGSGVLFLRKAPHPLLCSFPSPLRFSFLSRLLSRRSAQPPPFLRREVTCFHPSTRVRAPETPALWLALR